MTKFVDPVLLISILHNNMIRQVNKENHSITDLGPGRAKLYFQFYTKLLISQIMCRFTMLGAWHHCRPDHIL